MFYNSVDSCFAVVKASSSKSFSKGAIAGIAVGAATIVTTLSIFVFLWCTRKRWTQVPQKSFGKRPVLHSALNVLVHIFASNVFDSELISCNLNS